MRKIIKCLVPAVFFFQSVVLAHAVNPDEVLDNPILEQRARELSVNIRCLVCQNQSIDDSDAQLARDLRVLVREQLVEGKSDDEILDFLVERYGEFVLLKPRFGAHTLALWGLPIFVLLLGGIFAFRTFSKRPKIAGAAAVLSKEEQEALDAMINKES
ncbi:MAG: cytochrome c-type biogenesis protein CcmH [Rhizobiaceae bacterium]|nr:cytochrome c-type biogenesis protein CcmH [Rhizobiaceae bacterium]